MTSSDNSSEFRSEIHQLSNSVTCFTFRDSLKEFTPTKDGVVPWSCWMGMIPGTFIVKDDLTNVNSAQIEEELNSVPAPASGGSCGAASGGSCGCGA